MERSIFRNLALALLVVALMPTTVLSQENKLSLGYTLKSYSFSFDGAQDINTGFGATRKGFATLQFSRDLSEKFFLDVTADYLIPRTRDPLTDGPIRFNSANLGASIGAHLGENIDVTAGLRGGALWNLRLESEGVVGNSVWKLPVQSQINLNGAITAGLRYELLDFLAITASASRNFYQNPHLNPRDGFLEIPKAEQINLNSFSYQAGVSIGIPWEADLTPEREPTYRRAAPVVEDRRFAIDYEMRGYSYSYQPNDNFTGETNLIRKGFLRARYKQYLTNHFFLETSGGYMIPNRGDTFFSGGPLNFQAANLDLLMGIRWGRVSIFTGAEGGVLWDMRVKSQNQTDDIVWNSPTNVKSSFTGSFKAGMEYHILKHVSVKAQFYYNTYQHSNFQPDISSTKVPAIETAELAPFSAGVGISVSIPWKSRFNKGGRGPRPQLASGDQPKSKTQQDPDEVQADPPPVVERPPASQTARLSFTNPIPAREIMTSDFGDDRKHEGLDINANVGDPILSIARGEVIDVSWAGGYGKQVKVKHPAGFLSIYAHLSEYSVEVGDKVDVGDQLGLAGNTGDSTGPHLHFELLRMDLPINPRRYIIYDWTPLSEAYN